MKYEFREPKTGSERVVRKFFLLDTLPISMSYDGGRVWKTVILGREWVVQRYDHGSWCDFRWANPSEIASAKREG